MSTLLGCIADDFTGATDLAGMLARSGAPVSLRIGVPDEPPAQTASFEVIALKSRTAPVEEAVDECRRALAWLKKAGAEHFFWKYCSTFDSTPEGNIGPVAEALMADLGTDQTIYCPAFPENGRSIFMGNLFVGQQPLAESPMKDHPLTPMRDSNLMRLLEPQVSKSVGLVDRLTVAKGPEAIRRALDALKGEGVAHVVIDAVADEDLSLIAQACHTMPLLTGGSALAMPLPALYAAQGADDVTGVSGEKPHVDPRAIVLSGSCSAMTRKQVADYAAQAPSYHLDPRVLANDGPNQALAWLAAQGNEKAPLIYASAAPEDVRAAQDALGVERAGELVEDALATLAVAAREWGVRRFVVAGGETSGAVTKALGVTRLDIGVEIAPGVPWTYSQSAGVPIALTLKSGNFGSETFFSHALDLLETA
ncbi:MAG: four-carbon acid sugar kinase family protein [Rhizobiales bacterium]|nr:four-carbon acid sugar kinase family protein [Hyphomicrobiales bacterium]MBO6697922.1 four-carbon acid sugar kinase family protein [Hyphomicrobiales bacterium]MBO6735824.1 four-carbon acid sugar kinase family protein [Hyphomicrobiales bacterium]MBO6913835.1 four-carbon acid sugar kinase family protein [Hyphomicrobiales bacterium]MBO6955538.1 four-carbon acid sugar kinase family protein [Hyphomicrobiales bacterium]